VTSQVIPVLLLFRFTQKRTFLLCAVPLNGSLLMLSNAARIKLPSKNGELLLALSPLTNQISRHPCKHALTIKARLEPTANIIDYHIFL
jgi:hypothetical protein